jgi:large subunit ribosomal protein L1
MAKTKAELLEEAKQLGLEVTTKSTIAEITAAIEAASTVVEAPVQEAKVAKAGKRSEKGLEEAEAKQTKIEQQKHRDETAASTDDKPKAPVKAARSRLERRGKHFRKSAELLEAGKQYTLDEAVELAKKTSHVKFDATVELHINLGVDPRHADQNIRDNLVLPAGTGKTVRVAVASEDLLAQLDKGIIDFDILVSTPEFMPKLGKYARVLGPKGLMPNPKSGTVTTDVDKAVAEAKAGRVEFRVDTTGIVHLGVGKVSFTPAQLLQNVQAVLASVKAAKPSSVKGSYVQAIHLTTSMGPSIAVDIATIG